MGIRTVSGIKVIRRGISVALPVSSENDLVKTKWTPREELIGKIKWENFGPGRGRFGDEKTPLKLSRQLQQQLYRNARGIIDNFLELYYGGEETDSAYDIDFAGDRTNNYSIGFSTEGYVSLAAIYKDLVLQIQIGDDRHKNTISAMGRSNPKWELSNEVDLFRSFVLRLLDDSDSLREMA